MPLNYNSSGVATLDFSQFGLTSSVVGITTRVTMFDTSSGGTTSTYFVPPSPNYVLATGLSATISSTTATTVTGGILSLTAAGAYPVSVQLFGGTGGYIQSQNLGQQMTALVRVIRGPSTIIGEALVSQFLEFNVGSDQNALSLPPSAFNFIDFPSAGSATYVLQVNASGTSGLISLRNVSMFVRQIV